MNSPDPIDNPQPKVGTVPSLSRALAERKAIGEQASLRKIRHSIPRSSRFPDATFGAVIFLSAVSIFAVVVLIAWQLIDKSRLSLHHFGIAFFYGHDWDPVNGDFGALSFIYGTLVSSFLALLIAVPLSIGVAVFLTEMCPVGLRSFISFLVELLAAIPSVIYGLWGIFVLAPLLRDYVEPFLARRSGGRDSLPARCTVLECSRQASSWLSWLSPS